MGLFGSKKPKETGTGGGTVTLPGGDTITISEVVDCIGDSCPRPQLMTKKAMAKAASGAIIEVKVDNPSSVEALPPMCDELDATHLDTVKDDRCWHVYIKKD